MEIQLIDNTLLSELHEKARASERLRQNYDLRTTPADGSQRMLNTLEMGTRVPIHRHLKTSESVVCIEGCLDWIFYEEMVDMDTGRPVHDGETIDGSLLTDNGSGFESFFKEVARFRVCPKEGVHGIQVPRGAWHSIEVYEPSTIFEAKDGPYGE